MKKAERHSFVIRLTIPVEKIPTGKPIESMPIITERVRSGQISDNRVGVITRIPPTAKPDSSRTATTHSHEGAKLINNVSMPNDPTDSERAFALPIRSLIKPQVNPPTVHPAMYSALMIALIDAMSSGPERSLATLGRNEGMSVEMSPANTLQKKQIANDIQR